MAAAAGWERGQERREGEVKGMERRGPWRGEGEGREHDLMGRGS